MPLIARWRGRDLPTGGIGGPYLYTGDNGFGDTPGPTYVENKQHLQSRMWVNAPRVPGLDLADGRRGIGMSHYAGVGTVDPDGTECWAGWSAPDRLPVAPPYWFRLHLYFTGTTIWNQGNRPFIYGYTGGNSPASAVRRWSVWITTDTGPQVRSSLQLGIYNVQIGRKVFIAADGQTNSGLAPNLAPTGNAPESQYQLGGNAFNGQNPVANVRIHGWVTSAGLLRLQIFDNVNSPTTLRASLDYQLDSGNRAIDTLCIGTRPRSLIFSNDYVWSEIEWHSGDPDAWPLGPYVPQPARFSRVVSSNSVASTAQSLSLASYVDGPAGGLTGQAGVTATPLTAFTWRGEEVLNPYRVDDEVTYTGGATGGNVRALTLYRPRAQDYAGPYPILLWFHSGFFSAGSRRALPLKWMSRIVSQGFAVATVSYPLVDSPPTLTTVSFSGQVKHPRQIAWAKRAAYFFQQSANATTWNIDPTKVFISGYSAGGNLAHAVNAFRDVVQPDTTDTRMTAFFPDLPSGTPDPLVRGSFCWAGPVNWQRLFAEDSTGFVIRSTALSYMGLGFDRSGQESWPVSVTNYVNSTDAPYGYVAGSADVLVPPTQLGDLRDACSAANVGFFGRTIVADHDNIDTINDPLDVNSGVVPWMQRILSGQTS